MPTQTTDLFLLEDLEDVGKTSKLADNDLAALHAVADWIKTFVVRPHEDLGRAGAVCPFVPGALERKTLWLAPEQIADRGVPHVVELINGYKSLFLDAEPTDGDDANYKVIVVVFTDLSADRAQGDFDDLLQQLAVPSYVEDGIVFGPFYEGNEGTGIYNSSFRPFQSPVPFLFVRQGVISDWKFFLDTEDWLNLWTRYSRPRSTARPGAGVNRPSETSSTGTRLTGAVTSPPGSSCSCSPRRSGPRSRHCVNRHAIEEVVMSNAVETPAEIRPFHVDIPDEELADLRRRIAATRWPDKETVTDHSQGVPLAMTQGLADYWATDYDWRQCEAELNSLPQFITEIDGLDIHFVHVRSEHDDALPLIVNHGWPGSIVEQLKIIDPLSDPTAHGASASDAFHVVIPSMPGYGFSGKPTSTGWGPERMGRAWAELMKRLGYTRYVAQGGDWGAFVVDQMGLQAPEGLLAIHTNMPATVPADVDKALQVGEPPPSGLSADERRAYEQLDRTFKQVDYARYMAARPQTLYGIADSPVGLAAWLLDHNDADGQPAAAVASALDRTTSDTGELTRDEILDNATLYWLTNTGVSASRLYWEYKGGFFNAKGVSIPVAVTVFPSEQYQAPRSWTEEAYPNLIYFNEVDQGGHFAAWEQPLLFAEELRAAFRSLR